MIRRAVRHGARAVFGYARRTRAYPRFLRKTLTTGLVLGAFGARYLLFGKTGTLPFLLFFPSIIVASVMFSRGSGIYATLLSAAIAVLAFAAPGVGFAVSNDIDILAVTLFVLVGTFTAVVVEALRDAMYDADAAHAEAEAAKRARDLLLVELGHRTKNDMARIHALLTIQATTAEPRVAEALRDAADRVSLLSRLHARLHLTETSVVVDSREFLTGLVHDLSQGISGVSPVSLSVDAEGHAIPPSRAGALGLILNEIVTNSLKHGFPNGRGGTIHVRFVREGDTYLLSVSDNGVGYKGHGTGLGSRIIHALSSQLGGTTTIEPGCPGARSALRFPVGDSPSEGTNGAPVFARAA